MGLLNGGIAELFGSVFGSFYLDATLLVPTFVPDGQGGGENTTQPQPVKVQRNELTQPQREAQGYAESDVAFIVLTRGAPDSLNADCLLQFEGTTYTLHDPRLDPAGSHWLVRGKPNG